MTVGVDRQRLERFLQASVAARERYVWEMGGGMPHLPLQSRRKSCVLSIFTHASEVAGLFLDHDDLPK